MNILKAIIVDDEKSARDTLTLLIKKYCPNVQLVEICDSVDSGLEMIRLHKPDLVFLDIDMPVKDGFDLLEQNTGENFKTIFTTAFDHFALKAIKFSALDYLLKPVNIDELVAAVNKASQIDKPMVQLEALRSYLKRDNLSKLGKIILPSQNGYSVEDIDQIVRCESDSNYTMFYFTDNRKTAVCRVLKEYDEILSDLGFLRVHQSHLVNIKHIKKYVKGDSPYLIMSDGKMVAISRNKKTEFLNAFFKGLVS